MKQKKIELDVDFIGGQGALTVEEEKLLSDFFKQRKMTFQKPQNKISTKTVKHSKTTA
ncbi:MAG TPA: hypothetical protein PKV50_09275 [Prolixibacteraceae bacterium]|nr:hypothetical protein [Prolixibacteraceae bacterium]